MTPANCRDSRIPDIESALRRSPGAWNGKAIIFLFGDLQAILPHGDCVSREFLPLSMEGQREANCQELLNHHLHLVDCRHARRVRLARYIESFGLEPRWASPDLARMEVVGELE